MRSLLSYRRSKVEARPLITDAKSVINGQSSLITDTKSVIKVEAGTLITREGPMKLSYAIKMPGIDSTRTLGFRHYAKYPTIMSLTF